MEPALLIAALAGALAGLAASAIPGLHVNGLAALALALASSAGAPGQAFLVAAFAASPFGGALPGTFVGASGEEGALASLPAHALAREGRGVEAVALQAWGAFAGILVALPLALAALPLFAWLGPKLGTGAPWLAIAILALLVAIEPARPKVHRRALPTPLRERGRLVTHERVEGPLSPWAGRALALLVVVLAGALGWAALRLGAASPLGLPATPLLPLLAGLFAAPELLAAARARKPGPRAALRALPPRGLLRNAIPGAAASCVEGLVPAVSPSMAAMLTPRAGTTEGRLVRLAAVNGGGVVFTLLAWHAFGRARSGALVAAQAMGPAPSDLAAEALRVVLAAAIACLLVRALSMPVARACARVGIARWAVGGLALVALSTLAFAGWLGALDLAAATIVGLVPRRLGVRRTLGMAALLVPIALRGFGVG
ncbi:MAG: putative rane protein [Thermoplasmata archaeon]|nr:putative rane protein [Thermoplasmata archaeon]